MRFLFEQEIDNTKQNINTNEQNTKRKFPDSFQQYRSYYNKAIDERDYFLLSKEKQLELVKELLKKTLVSHPNDWAYSIIDDGNYYKDNYKFITANLIPQRIDEIVEHVLLQLTSKSNPYAETVAESDWIKDYDLYNDTPTNIAFKIKALTLADDNNIDINKTFKNKDGKWYPIEMFRTKAIESLQGIKAKTGNQTIYDFLLSNRAIGNIKEDPTTLYLFLSNVAFPKSRYKDKYEQFKSIINKRLKDNEFTLIQLFTKFGQQELLPGMNIENISNSFIKLLSEDKIMNLSMLRDTANIEPSDRDATAIKQTAVDTLIGMGMQHSEAQQLINRVYEPGDTAEKTVNKAIKANK